jgi:hypothetical protein
MYPGLLIVHFDGTGIGSVRLRSVGMPTELVVTGSRGISGHVEAKSARAASQQRIDRAYIAASALDSPVLLNTAVEPSSA